MASTAMWGDGDPNKIPTTDEMDGLLTPEDIAKKYSVFLQCRQCNKWTPADYRHLKNLECSNCSAHDFDSQSITSERSFNPFNKRKVKK
jgi:hypothetical protein